MEQRNEQLQRLRDYLNRTKGQRYPFSGHWLEDEDGYLKNAWLKMLCMVLQSVKDISEEQTLFLQRLIAGIGAEYDVQTYMRQGMEVTPEALEEFIELLLDDTKDDADEKRYAFVLDALLLIHLGEADEDVEELLAQVCEALLFKMKEIEGMAKVCKNILCQDIADCIIDSYNFIGRDISHIIRPFWFEYAGICRADRDNAVAAVSDRSQYTDISSLGDKAAISPKFKRMNKEYNSIAGISLENREYVRFDGLKIPVSTNLLFQNIDHVEFHNCEFIGAGEMETSNGGSIWLQNCKSVRFDSCSFRYFGSQTIYVLEKSDLQMVDCSFSDCILKLTYGDWTGILFQLGGVIYGRADETELRLESCVFANCGCCNTTSARFTSILSNCRTNVRNCRFENCWSTKTDISGASKDTNSGGCLFAHILSESNNEVIDSAKLGPN